MLKHALRRSVAFIALTLVAGVLPTVSLSSPAEAAVDPVYDDALRAAIVDALGDIAELTEFGDFSRELPLLDQAPAAMLQARAVIEEYAAAVESSPADLQVALSAFAPSTPGITVEIVGPGPGASPVVDDLISGDGRVDAVFQLIIGSMVTAPLSYDQGDGVVISAAGAAEVEVILSTSMLHVQLDTDALAASPGDAVFFRALPDPAAVPTPTPPGITLAVTANATLAAFDASIGIAAVEAAGSLDIDVQLNALLQDPDGDERITVDELAGTGVGALFSASFADDPTTDAFAATLDLSSPTVPGLPTGQLSITDAAIDATAPVINVSIGGFEDFLSLRSDDLIGLLDRVAGLLESLQGTGTLDLELPYIGGSFGDSALDGAGDSFNELVPLGARLRMVAAALRQVDDPATLVDESLQPRFDNLDQFVAALATEIPGINPVYNAATNQLDLQISISDAGTGQVPLSFGQIGDFLVAPSGVIDIEAGYEVTVPISVDLTPLPTEGVDGGPISCVDGIDNDSDGLTDAADADCADTPTLDERILVDLPGVVVSAGVGASATGIDTEARLGIVGAQVEDASLAITGVGGPAGCTDCAAVSVALTPTGAESKITLPELVYGLIDHPDPASPQVDKVDLSATVDASLAATIPVSADLGGVSLGGGDIVISGTLSGDLTSPSALAGSLSINTDDVSSSDLFDFNPCGNGVDDDGDGVIDDGCGAVEALADPEIEATGGLDSILNSVVVVSNQVSALDSASVSGVPLVGDALGDAIDWVQPVADGLGAFAAGSESALSGCANATDDDFDGVINDGCPSVDAGEGGSECLNNDDDDGDGVINDGCTPIRTTLDGLGTVLDGALDQHLEDAGFGTDAASVELQYDNVDKAVSIIATLSVSDSADVPLNLDLADLGIPALSGGSLLAIEGGGTLTVAADATVILGFGVDLDDLEGFVLADTGLELSAQASADDLDFAANLGPIQVSIGDPADLGSASIGAMITVGVTGGPGDRIPLADVGIGAPAISGVATPSCGASFACADLPIYVGGSLVSELTLDWADLTAAPTVGAVDGAAIAAAIGAEALDLLLLSTGLAEYIQKIQELITGELLGADLPLIGDQLGDNVDLSSLVDLSTAIDAALQGDFNTDGALVDLQVTLNDLVGVATTDASYPVVTVECGAATCVETSRLIDVSGVEFTAVSLDGGDSVEVPFDLGVDGFGLTSEDGVTLDYNWSVDLVFGIDKTVGFYVQTDDSGFAVDASVLAPDQMQGVLGFLQVDLTDGYTTIATCDPTTPVSPCRPSGADSITPVPRGVTGLPIDKSGLSAGFAVGFSDPSGDNRLTFAEMTGGGGFASLFSYDLTAIADLNFHAETSIEGDVALPRLLADFAIQACWSLTDAAPADLNGTGGSGTPDCSGGGTGTNFVLTNVYLDTGTFLQGFVQPILADVEKYTRPLDPVLDTLTDPIPVLSDFAGEPVTLLSLAEEFGPSDNTFGLILDLIELVAFIRDLATSTDGLAYIRLDSGGFDLDETRLKQGQLGDGEASRAFADPAQLTALNAGGGITGEVLDSGSESGSKSKLDGIGLTFPFLDEPSQLVGMLFGQDADLVVWRPQPLSAGFSYSQKFGPIWAVPPVFVEIGGSISITGRFGIGYDTQGLREVAFEGAGGANLLNGLFIVDTDASGTDVNELQIDGRLFANAQVSVLIFSAGAEGSIYATIGLDLEDPNADGKLKFAEIADIVERTANPLCIFNLNGKFGVMISVFAEVDLFFWSKKWSVTLADIVLYEFKVACDPDALDEPVLATSGNLDLDQYETGLGDGTSALETVLILNLGANRANRGSNSFGKNLADEVFTVRKLADGALEVTAIGVTVVYPAPPGGWDGVFADGNNEYIEGDDQSPRFGADTIVFADNVADAENPTTDAELAAIGASIPFDLNVVVLGSGADDAYTGGHGRHYIDGRDGNDQISTKEGDDRVKGGDGNDQIGLGQGDDTADGGEGDDTIDGGPGTDTLRGNAGDDTLVGGLTIPAADGRPEIPDGGDLLVGGADADTIDGGPGDDTIYGDGDSVETVSVADGGSDRLDGGIGADTIRGGDEVECSAADGSDRVLGDVIIGGPGSDVLDGEGGDDIVVGGSTTAGIIDSGDTLVAGGSGCDTIAGDNIEFDDPTDPFSIDLVDPDIGGGDVLTGGPGADIAHGQIGDDTIDGDAGNDLLFGEAGTDTVDGGPNDDVIHGDGGPGTAVPYPGAAGDYLAGGDGDDQVFGEEGADVIIGDIGDPTAVPVTLAGGTGNDELFGGPGADLMYGQAGSDEMLGNDGTDTMFGNADTDLMRGGPDADEMFGNDGGDLMWGDGGADHMVGGSNAADATDDGTDIMRGGAGADIMIGDNGSISPSGVETLLSEGAPGVPIEGAGDIMFGDSGEDRMFGEAGPDQMLGGANDDYLEGNADDDVMSGDEGQDDLIGGGDEAGLADGADQISGGLNIDVIAGDNAVITRPGGTSSSDGAVHRSVLLLDLGVGVVGAEGGDTIVGDFSDDRMFGQGGDDDIAGGPGDDYAEGNRGDDDIAGDGGQDDLIGGSSMLPGQPWTLRSSAPIGGGVSDGGDTITGGDDADVILGDNGSIVRPEEAGQWIVDDLDASRGIVDVVRRIVVLHDVATVTSGTPASVSGPDDLGGGDGRDVVYGQGDDDLVAGDGGDDYLEGNSGADTVDGGDGQDDILGGTGLVNDDTFIDGELIGGTAGRLDTGDILTGGDDHDVILGDNGIIDRLGAGTVWRSIDDYGHNPVDHIHDATVQQTSGSFSRVERSILMTDTTPGATSGSDRIDGGSGDDDLIGQFDDQAVGGAIAVDCAGAALPAGVVIDGDLICGGPGEDAMVGDQGVIENRREDGSRETVIEPKGPFVDDTVFLDRSLTRLVELTQIDDGGDDVLLGGIESDFIHGGAGDDLANGDSGDDRLFGAGGVDALWGGTGDDISFGGHDGDFLDVYPREDVPGVVDDPATWFAFATPGNTFEGFDYLYGGWNADAMQADVAGTGPEEGDRLIDWAGAHNVYYVCPANNGAWVSIRSIEPGLLEFLEDLATASGAVEVTTAGSSGHVELGLVQRKEIKDNTNPVHPDHPGHFTCDGIS